MTIAVDWDVEHQTMYSCLKNICLLCLDIHSSYQICSCALEVEGTDQNLNSSACNKYMYHYLMNSIFYRM